MHCNSSTKLILDTSSLFFFGWCETMNFGEQKNRSLLLDGMKLSITADVLC